MSTITLLINTKNEQKSLDKCITSAKAIASEIIVVDMKSTDDTLKIAKKHGAKIISIKDVGYVEPAREVGVKQATGEWILILDADEQLSPQLRKDIPQLIEQGPSVIAFPRKNIIFDQWMQGNDYWPNYQTRLYKKGSVSWPDTIHAGAVTKEQIYYLPADPQYALIHHVNVDPNYLLAKTDNYTSHETAFQQYVAEHGFEADAVFRYIQQSFSDGFVKNKGYRDGFGGYVMSKLMDTYRFAEVAKYWLKNNQPTMKNEKKFITLLKYEAEYKHSAFYKLWMWRKKLTDGLKD